VYISLEDTTTRKANCGLVASRRTGDLGHHRLVGGLGRRNDGRLRLRWFGMLVVRPGRAHRE